MTTLMGDCRDTLQTIASGTTISESHDEKECAKCGEYLPADAEFFYRCKKNWDDLHGWCKACCDTVTRLRREREKAERLRVRAERLRRYEIYNPFVIL
jgi:hypothetical protein